MDSGSFRRRMIALAAAYAVALQAVLLAFMPVATSGLTAEFGILCSHDGGVPDQPASHDLPCAAMCAALGHGVAGPLPPDFIGAIEALVSLAIVTPLIDWIAPHRVLSGPQIPRGPPLA